jgi:hypothetical protein
VKWAGLGGEGLLPRLLGHDAADVDEIISDYAEADQRCIPASPL